MPEGIEENIEEQEVLETDVEDDANDQEVVETGEDAPPEENTEEIESSETVEDEGDEEFVLDLGEEAQEQKADDDSALVKKLRREIKNRDKKLKEYERETTSQVPMENLKKPELSEYEYDEDKYDEALKTYYKAVAKQEQEKEALTKRQETLRNNYVERRDALKNKFDDVEEAEANVLDALSETQQQILLEGADDPGLLMYAIGKNSQRAEALAKINDPIKFAFAIAKLEGKVSVRTKGKSPKTKAEGRVSGDVSTANSSKGDLDRLLEEAQSTGNYTKVASYMKRNKKSS